jgi:hypothetical protein
VGITFNPDAPNQGPSFRVKEHRPQPAGQVAWNPDLLILTSSPAIDTEYLTAAHAQWFAQQGSSQSHRFERNSLSLFPGTVYRNAELPGGDIVAAIHCTADGRIDLVLVPLSEPFECENVKYACLT